MNLPNLHRAVDRRNVQHRHQTIDLMITSVHQHLRAPRVEHLKAHRFEIRHLANETGQLGMGIAFEHFLQHRPGNATASLIGLDRHVRHRARLGVALHRQVQQKA